ncbi:MAG TPA: HAD family hydrolase [Allocoleopsis sp.]
METYENITINHPKVIFLDAVGTIFGVRGSVGKVYADIAAKFGVSVSDEELNNVFYDVFYDSDPPMFPDIPSLEIPWYEYQWWLAIAKKTFTQLGVIDQFSDFDSFFGELYAHFATAEPWFVYPDVSPMLEYWQQQGITLGIISNFDSRIYAVLQALYLDNFFTSVTISTEVCAAKPDSKIFQFALDKHNCKPDEVWHIGDSLEEDYQGAKNMGIRAILLQREED